MSQVILDSMSISAPGCANAIMSRCRVKQNPPWWIFWPDRDALSDSGTCSRTRAWSLRKHPDRKLIARCWWDRMALQRHESVNEDREYFQIGHVTHLRYTSISTDEGRSCMIVPFDTLLWVFFLPAGLISHTDWNWFETLFSTASFRRDTIVVSFHLCTYSNIT